MQGKSRRKLFVWHVISFSMERSSVWTMTFNLNISWRIIFSTQFKNNCFHGSGVSNLLPAKKKLSADRSQLLCNHLALIQPLVSKQDSIIIIQINSIPMKLWWPSKFRVSKPSMRRVWQKGRLAETPTENRQSSVAVERLFFLLKFHQVSSGKEKGLLKLKLFNAISFLCLHFPKKGKTSRPSELHRFYFRTVEEQLRRLMFRRKWVKNKVAKRFSKEKARRRSIFCQMLMSFSSTAFHDILGQKNHFKAIDFDENNLKHQILLEFSIRCVCSA